MQIIGIRSSAQEVRYAILERDTTDNIVFINKNTEHCLRYPAGIHEVKDKLLWIKREFERVFRQHADIAKIIIKTNEYSGNENGARRETSYVDAIILLLAAERETPVERKLYTQIGTTSRQTKEHAESRVGKTDKYWNSTIADAINSAYSEIRRK